MMWFAVLIQLLGCGLFGEEGADSRERPPALVRVAPAEAGDLTEYWSGTGEVRALDAAELGAGAAGPVSRVPLREGDLVSRGTLLVEVDQALVSARVDAAAAAVAGGEAELTRREQALARRAQVDAGVLAAEELSEAESAVEIQVARVDGLRAAEAEARALLGRHRIRAPFDGVVTVRHVDPGDWVDVGELVVEVVSTGQLEVRVHVPRDLAARLSVDGGVEVGAGAGSIVAIVPTLDRATRTALVRVAPAADLSLTAGQSVDVRLPIEWRGIGVRVPRDAILLDPKQDRVLKIVEGVAESLPVTVIARGERDVLVHADGLSAGDQVVVRGNESVRPGQPVRIEGAE